MSILKYSITQKVNLDGNTVVRTFGMEADKAEVQLLTAKLAGEITARVEEPDLISGSDTLINTVDAKFVQNIRVGYKTTDGDYLSKYISSYDNRPLIFLSTASKTDIEATLLPVKMVKSFPTLKPTSVDANMQGTKQSTTA